MQNYIYCIKTYKLLSSCLLITMICLFSKYSLTLSTKFRSSTRLLDFSHYKSYSTSRLFETTSIQGSDEIQIPKNSGRKTLGISETRSSPSNQKIDILPPKGTRDFYPEDHRLKQWLFNLWRDVGGLYGFEEYDAPVVESESLFVRKAGEEVTQQLYNFEDKGGRKLSLRPEMTPSLARMVLAKGMSLPLPIKWFAIPQCWRYEKMTRGRRREHYQWNMDIWGVDEIDAEVELLSAIITFFQKIGITSSDVGIKINSRKVLNDMMNKLNIPEDKWADTCVLIDKLDKVSLDSLEEELQTIGLERKVVDELVSYIQIKDMNKLKEVLGENSQGLSDINSIFELMSINGNDAWLEFDPSVVRGLSYYTGVVFEGFDKSKTLRAICGGGRYDNLLQSLGSPEKICAVGFGFGDAVIMELLKMKELVPDFSKGDIDVIVFPMVPDLKKVSIEIAHTLRQEGLKTDLILQNKKSKWAFQRGDRVGSKYLIMIAPEEFKENKVVLKDLSLGKQDIVSISELVQTIRLNKEKQ